MEAIKRKRVTRVGSGAWSIYLPKKWIDAWPPAQQAGREVDLHLISGSLLIVPVEQERAYAAEVPGDVAGLRVLLLSAYVRGCKRVDLHPRERFTNEAIAACRDLLRHLDERIVATVGPDRIAFTLADDGAGPTDLLQTMGARLAETLDLAAECVEHAPLDAERVIHAARLLDSIQNEDVARLLHQTLRRVATLELPLESVTDFQLLDLAAFLLHGIGAQCLTLATTALADLGLDRKDLAYPHEDLLARLPRRDAPPPVARDILQGHRASLREARDLLRRLLAALAQDDMADLAAIAQAAAAANTALQTRVFEAVVRHWGDEASKEDVERGYAAYQLVNPLANILGALQACAEQAQLFLAAKAPAEAKP